MKVYIVLCNGDYCEVVVKAIFTNRKTAGAFMVKGASEEMDLCQIDSKDRRCGYLPNGDLHEIYDAPEYYCDWLIVERELEED